MCVESCVRLLPKSKKLATGKPFIKAPRAHPRASTRAELLNYTATLSLIPSFGA
jgi:hypothetical protein